MEVVLSDYGEYLGTKNGQNLAVFQKRQLTREVEIFKVDNVYLFEGNSLSTSALTLCASYDIPVFVLSRTGKLLSSNYPFNENGEARVKTRLAQYESLNNGKGKEIAKKIILAKIENQKAFLRQYGFSTVKLEVQNRIERMKIDDFQEFRMHINNLEARCSKWYFKAYVKLLPRIWQPQKRMKYKAKDKFNNLLNLGYEILAGEIYKAVLLAHLDAYLGYVHSQQYLKPSLICDFQELFRQLIDKFLLSYVLELDIQDSFEKRGNRTFLTPKETGKFITALNNLFNRKIDHMRMKQFGKKSKIKTIIREEPLKLAQFLRDEKSEYQPVNIMSEIKEMNRFI